MKSVLDSLVPMFGSSISLNHIKLRTINSFPQTSLLGKRLQ